MDYKEFAEKYNIGLNEKQIEAVIDESNAALLLAVPGSGKTTVIVAKVGYMILCREIPASQILTVTYSKAAAVEMEERFRKVFPNLPTPHFSTIHSYCLSVLRYSRDAFGTSIPTLIPDNEGIVRKIVWDIGKEYPTEYMVKEAALGITMAKNKMLLEKEIKAINPPELSANGISFIDVYRAYQAYLQASNSMDFDDMLVLTYDMFTSSTELLQYFQDKFPYINVDEAQDTSLLQHSILNLLGNCGHIFMVGDDDQSIYGFRGADPTNLLQFENNYPGAKTYFMEANYRCSPVITEAANIFISQNEFRYDKTIAPQRNNDGIIRLTTTMGRDDQYDLILKRIKAALNGAETLGVLYRNNESGFPIAEAATREGLNVRRRDSLSVFFEHSAVSDMCNLLAFFQDPHNEALFLKLYYKLGLYLKKSEALAAVELHQKKPELNLMECVRLLPDLSSKKVNQVDRFIISLHGFFYKSPSGAIKDAMDLFYRDYITRSKRELAASSTQKIDTLLVVARHYKDIGPFLQRIEEMKTAPQDTRMAASNVTVSTIHASKGLEFDHVIIIDAIEGVFPPGNSNKITHTVEDEEEARLFYVGLTRARTSVEFIVPQWSYGEAVYPSPYISVVCGTKAEKKKQKKEREKTNKEAFKPGAKVEHITFGQGKVCELNGDIISVQFDSSKLPKKLQLSVCLKKGFLRLLS